MPTPLSDVRGLGSAKHGVDHWWIQRVTAVALVPLTVWFIASLIVIARSDYNAVVVWLQTPLATIFMALLMVALFYHMALGLQVVAEDYVHSDRVKIPIVPAMHLACFALAAAGVFAILHIAVVK